MATDGRSGQEAWQALQETAVYDERLRGVLGELALSPEASGDALRRWLLEYGGGRDVPPAIANYIAGGHVERLINIARAQTVNLVLERPAPKSLFTLPADFAHFTGRQREVTEIVELLVGERGNASAVAIVGLAGKPGVGKSALAIHVAHQLVERFPDAQLYIDLRGTDSRPLDPNAALLGFLGALGLTGREIPQELDQRAMVYRAQLDRQRALIVLDNAHDEAQVRPFLPGSSSCAVLITSLSPLGALDGARVRTLGVLDQEAAARLLGKFAGRERIAAEPQYAAEVAELCGYLPLAVRIAGGILAKNPTWTLAELAGRLRDKPGRLQELRLGDLGVGKSFAASYDALTSDEQRLFRNLGALSGPNFGADVAAVLDDTSPEVCERTLESLVDAQLLEALAEDRYEFHDLIRLFARERAREKDSPESTELAAARARRWYLQQTQLATTPPAALDAPGFESRGLAAALALQWHLRQLQAATTTGMAPSDPMGDNNRHVNAVGRPGLGWLTVERANLVAAVEQAYDAGDWQTTQQLAISLTAFFWLRSHWNDWQRTHELALDAAIRTSDRYGESLLLAELGNVYLYQGRWEEANDSCERSLLIARKVGDRNGEARALDYLGSIRFVEGRWEDGKDYWEQSLRIARELGDRYDEALTLRSLGFAAFLQRRWEDAIACYEQSREIRRELGDEYGEALVLGDLGDVYREQGRWEDAIACFEHALHTQRQLDDRYREAYTLGRLGLVYGRQGRWKNAIDCHERALQTYRELGDRNGEARTLGPLGFAYRRQGHSVEAIDCYNGMLETWRALGNRHGEAAALGNLGDFYREQRRLEEAIDHVEQGLNVMRELHDRHGEAQMLGELGHVYFLQERWQNAIDCYQRTLQSYREINDRYSETLWLGNLGNVHLRQERFGQAMDCYEQALRTARELGDRYNEAGSLANIAQVLILKRDKHGAKRHLREALAIFDDLGVPDAEAVRRLLKMVTVLWWWMPGGPFDNDRRRAAG